MRERKGNGSAFTLFAGLALIAAGALSFPEAYQNAVDGLPGNYSVRDSALATDVAVATRSDLDPAPSEAEFGDTVEVVNADDRVFESEGRGPLVLVPPILLGVAGLVTSAVGLRRLRERKGPGAT
ncbi:hypothetical protein [Lentzea waywayandensis]|nr:hypothetical protein [Lentzea waywayandensis]